MTVPNERRREKEKWYDCRGVRECLQKSANEDGGKIWKKAE